MQDFVLISYTSDELASNAITALRQMGAIVDSLPSESGGGQIAIWSADASPISEFRLACVKESLAKRASDL